MPEGIATVLDALSGGQPIDVFVHNTGINAVARFDRSDPARTSELIDLNLLAPLLLTAGLIRRGILAEHACLVFVASLSCQLGYPGAAAYAASKDGLASFAASLHAAAPLGLRTLTIFPGPTRTGHAAEHSPDNSRAHRRMAPDSLAAKILAAIESHQTTLVPGAANKAMAAAGTLFPHTASRLTHRALLGIPTATHTPTAPAPPLQALPRPAED
ncbi:hypothetical protein BH23VER1_BH23VER1_20610 [soil metagenome]